MAGKGNSAPEITFISQSAPIDEYGRALYAVARSVLRAMYDSVTAEDLRDMNTPSEDVTMRQLAKFARIDRDHGLLGDGFEWAVHEAVLGKERCRWRSSEHPNSPRIVNRSP